MYHPLTLSWRAAALLVVIPTGIPKPSQGCLRLGREKEEIGVEEGQVEKERDEKEEEDKVFM